MDPQHGPKLGLVLGGVLERFWEGFWKPGCAEEGPRRRQDGHEGIVFGIDFLMDVKCDFGWVSWGVLGASWGVLGSSWGPSWDVLRRLGRIFFGLRCDFGWFWMVWMDF